MSKKTAEEEAEILDNIDNISRLLSDQVVELQTFIKELRKSRENQPFLFKDK